MAAAKKKKKKNIEYQLNINLNYHISSHTMTKLNRLHLTTLSELGSNVLFTG